MAEIDVTDVLLDPFIAGESITVLRRQQVVDAHGIASVVTTSFPGVLGSVFPAGDNSLVREDAYQTQAKSISVVTSFRLRGVAETVGGIQWQPDIVVWRGDNFLVREVKDWSRFGAGMIEADCSSIDFVDQPPQA